MAENGKTGWKAAVLKAIVQVIVALMGLAGVGLGVWAQMKSGNTNDALQATVEQFNTRTIPMLETLLKEQREETRKVRDKVFELRERVAYLEALTRQVAEKTRTKFPKEDQPLPVKHETVEAKVMSAGVDGELKEPDLIPRLDVQQLQKKAE